MTNVFLPGTTVPPLNAVTRQVTLLSPVITGLAMVFPSSTGVEMVTVLLRVLAEYPEIVQLPTLLFVHLLISLAIFWAKVPVEFALVVTVFAFIRFPFTVMLVIREFLFAVFMVNVAEAEMPKPGYLGTE